MIKKMLQSKKGNTLAIIGWSAGTIVIVLWLSGFAYFFNSITITLVNIPAVNTIVNVSDVATKVFVPINNAMSGLNYISYILIITLALAILIESYYVKGRPVLFAVHLLVVISAVLGSIYISNAYESLMTGNILSSQIVQHSGASWIILNLPTITAIIGVMGFVIMLINFNRESSGRVSV